MPDPDFVRRTEIDALIEQRRHETRTALATAQREISTLSDRVSRLEALVWKVVTGALTGAGGIAYGVSELTN